MISYILALLSSFLIYNHNGPEYTLYKSVDHVEFRDYDAWIVAQTIVQSTQEDAGQQAFHILAGYIFGNNDQKVKIEMTAPVVQQQVGQGKYSVQFFMPKGWTLSTLPKPNDYRVIIREIPERKLAAWRYNGGWSQHHYNEEVTKAQNELKKLGVQTKNQPIWARYNSPMAPTLLRTNEIIFEI